MLELGESFLAAPGVIGSVPRRIQHAHECIAHSLVVVHYQHVCGLGASSAGGSRLSMKRLGDWQAYCEGCAFSQSAARLNSAAVSFDYAVTDRELEPGAHYSFCRKERLGVVIAHLAGHSDSAIGHARSHKSAFCPGGDFQPP